MLLNLKKDEEELAEQIKFICTVIRPEAFLTSEGDEKAVSNTFIEDLELQLGRKLTDQEKYAIGGTSGPEEEEIDVIERM